MLTMLLGHHWCQGGRGGKEAGRGGGCDAGGSFSSHVPSTEQTGCDALRGRHVRQPSKNMVKVMVSVLLIACRTLEQAAKTDLFLIRQKHWTLFIDHTETQGEITRFLFFFPLSASVVEQATGPPSSIHVCTELGNMCETKLEHGCRQNHS